MNEFNTNEIKYLNSLALIAEIRKELKAVKFKYGQATGSLGQKLEQKTRDFEKLRQGFVDLKREICLQAAFESTQKKIP